jgi:hypothetical protein
MPLDAYCQLWVVSCEIRKISICILYFFTREVIKLKSSFDITDNGLLNRIFLLSLIEFFYSIKVVYYTKRLELSIFFCENSSSVNVLNSPRL